MVNNYDEILAEYRQKFGLFEDLSRFMGRLVGDILTGAGLTVHSVTCRTKSVASLSGKLRRPEKTYQHLNEVTDLSGLRIITHFHDDVDRVAEVIAAELHVHLEASVDKRKTLDPDRFGYVSLHHVCSLADQRAALTEYHRFAGIRFEVQIRSVLQHAWAEIEHDLGYKSPQGVPALIRRRFSRLAALREMADEQLVTIRDGVAEYRQEVEAAVLEQPATVEINRDSFLAWVAKSDDVKRVDMRIANVAQLTIGPLDPELADGHAKRLRALGYNCIEEVESDLQAEEGHIVGFARKFLEGRGSVKTAAGISTFYLGYVKVGRRGDISQVLSYLAQSGIGRPEEQPDTARRVLEAADAMNQDQ